MKNWMTYVSENTDDREMPNWDEIIKTLSQTLKKFTKIDDAPYTKNVKFLNERDIPFSVSKVLDPLYKKYRFYKSSKFWNTSYDRDLSLAWSMSGSAGPGYEFNVFLIADKMSKILQRVDLSITRS